MTGKSFRYLIFGTFVLLVFLGVCALLTSVSARTIIVDDNADGPPGNPYKTIQEAVDDSMDGDTIRVYAGTYNEDIFVNKSLTFIGNGSGESIVHGDEFENHAFFIWSDRVNISGFSITGSTIDGYGIGVYVTYGNVTIDRCEISNSDRGLYIGWANSAKITNSSFLENHYTGVYVSRSTNTSIRNSTFSSTDWIGCKISDSNNISLMNNHFSSNIYGILSFRSEGIFISENEFRENENGLSLSYEDQDAIITNNSFIRNNGTSVVFQHSFRVSAYRNVFLDDHQAFYLPDSHDLSIHNNSIQNCAHSSIYFFRSENVSLDSNNMTGSGIHIYGESLDHWSTHSIPDTNTLNGSPIIYLKNVSGQIPFPFPGQLILANCTSMNLTGLNMSDSNHGIQIGFCGDLNISENRFRNFTSSAIRILNSENITLSNNVLSDSEYGVLFDRQQGSLSVWGNEFVDNLFGISIVRGEGNSVVQNNSFTSNHQGIRISRSAGFNVRGNDLLWNEYGLILSYSSSNTVIDNNISHNTIQGLAISYESHNNTIENNTINGNVEGIFIRNNVTGNLLKGNEIYGNTVYGMNASHVENQTIDASGNWWGNNHGPYHESLNPEGKGNTVIGPVDFVPWALRDVHSGFHVLKQVSDTPRVNPQFQDAVSYSFTITNQGTFPDSYKVAIEVPLRSGIYKGWQMWFSDTGSRDETDIIVPQDLTTSDWLNLSNGESITLTLNVIPHFQEDQGLYQDIVVSVQSVEDPPLVEYLRFDIELIKPNIRLFNDPGNLSIYQYPSWYKPGDYRITVNVYNDGTAPTGEFDVWFYNGKARSTYHSSGDSIYKYTIGNIEPGEFREAIVEWDAVPLGQNDVYVFADKPIQWGDDATWIDAAFSEDGAVLETRENDNTASLDPEEREKLNLFVDVSITNIEFVNNFKGSRCTMKFYITNYGTVTTQANSIRLDSTVGGSPFVSKSMSNFQIWVPTGLQPGEITTIQRSGELKKEGIFEVWAQVVHTYDMNVSNNAILTSLITRSSSTNGGGGGSDGSPDDDEYVSTDVLITLGCSLAFVLVVIIMLLMSLVRKKRSQGTSSGRPLKDPQRKRSSRTQREPQSERSGGTQKDPQKGSHTRPQKEPPGRPGGRTGSPGNRRSQPRGSRMPRDRTPRTPTPRKLYKRSWGERTTQFKKDWDKKKVSKQKDWKCSRCGSTWPAEKGLCWDCGKKRTK